MENVLVLFVVFCFCGKQISNASNMLCHYSSAISFLSSCAFWSHNEKCCMEKEKKPSIYILCAGEQWALSVYKTHETAG